jgi:hypothetical protein
MDGIEVHITIGFCSNAYCIMLQVAICTYARVQVVGVMLEILGSVVT